MDARVEVDGLIELQKALREVGKDLPRELRVANLAASKKVVAGATQRAEALSPLARLAAESLKARAEQRGASVRLGGPRYPFAPGAEFGSIDFEQFPPWRGNGGDAGYFLYPTIREEGPEIVDEYVDALDRLLRRAQLK